MQVFMGADPGKSGGIAELTVEPLTGRVAGVRTWSMPATEKDLMAILEDLGDVWAAVVEDVASSPQMGVKSAFSFGRSFGSLLTAIVAAGIPVELVKPARWQRALGCLSGGDKNRTKARAQALFPGVKVTHATADALLLAEYGRRLFHGGAIDGKG